MRRVQVLTRRRRSDQGKMGIRRATITRTTDETDIELVLNLDGSGISRVETGIPFFDHMLTLFARHSLCDLDVRAEGDIEVDYHHTVEDVGICLGLALKEALGEKVGIKRYGTAILPMDEALVMTAIDLCGRAYLGFEVPMETGKVGDFDTELVEEFFRALANNAGMVLHIRLIAGKNIHHIIEGIFKAFGRAVDEAVAFDERVSGVPSTKGRLI
jgi:imidazoleglycerol-phosphate dehydratase